MKHRRLTLRMDSSPLQINTNATNQTKDAKEDDEMAQADAQVTRDQADGGKRPAAMLMTMTSPRRFSKQPLQRGYKRDLKTRIPPMKTITRVCGRHSFLPGTSSQLRFSTTAESDELPVPISPRSNRVSKALVVVSRSATSSNEVAVHLIDNGL